MGVVLINNKTILITDSKFIMKTTRHYLILTLLLFSQFHTMFAQEKKDTLQFVHLSDLHLIFSPEIYNDSFINGRYNYFWKDSNPVKNFFKTTAPSIEADFIAITGDLIDFYEAETNDGRMLATQIEQFKRFTDSITNQTLYLTLGNHDITSYPKGSYNQNSANMARSSWVKNVPVFSNGTYYSRIYEVGSTTYRLIFLDNSYFSGRTNKEQADFIIDIPQLDWLKSQLKESSYDKEIIFMHMPLPSYNSDEQTYDEYIERSRTSEFMNIITETDNSSVQVIVAGHRHKNEIHLFDFPDKPSFTQVLTGAFGNSVENWRIIELTESDIIIHEPHLSNDQLKIPLK